MIMRDVMRDVMRDLRGGVCDGHIVGDSLPVSVMYV